MVEKFETEYQRRLFEANQKVLECYELLDPNDEHYHEDLEALAKISKELAADFKAYGDLKNEEVTHYLEKERQVEEKKSGRIGHILQGIGLALSGLTFFASTFMKDKHFKMASKYEEENAYLKSSDRRAVDDALKDEPQRPFWQFWK